VKREAGGVICTRGDTACVRAAIATANATRNSHREGTPLRGAYYTRGVASPHMWNVTPALPTLRAARNAVSELSEERSRQNRMNGYCSINT